MVIAKIFSPFFHVFRGRRFAKLRLGPKNLGQSLQTSHILQAGGELEPRATEKRGPAFPRAQRRIILVLAT